MEKKGFDMHVAPANFLPAGQKDNLFRTPYNNLFVHLGSPSAAAPTPITQAGLLRTLELFCKFQLSPPSQIFYWLQVATQPPCEITTCPTECNFILEDAKIAPGTKSKESIEKLAEQGVRRGVDELYRALKQKFGKF